MARNGYALVVIESIGEHPHWILIFILYFLLEVVFAVGGDTDTTEWLDTEAGNKNHFVDPRWYSSERTLASVFHTHRSLGSLFQFAVSSVGGRRMSGDLFFLTIVCQRASLGISPLLHPNASVGGRWMSGYLFFTLLS